MKCIPIFGVLKVYIYSEFIDHFPFKLLSEFDSPKNRGLYTLVNKIGLYKMYIEVS